MTIGSIEALYELVSLIQKRFDEKIIKIGPDDCWLWTDSLAPNGYGKMRIPGKEE